MGQRNRMITVERKTVVRDRYGGSTETWAPLARVWAEKLWVKPAERYITSSNRTGNVSSARFRMLQRTDVDETMRVIDDSRRTWDIRGIIKNDRENMTLILGALA